MSSLRFTHAPSLPAGVAQEVWEAEWVDLRVGLASVFPRTIGYLGPSVVRASLESNRMRCTVTAENSMNVITDMLAEPMWVSRKALVYAYKYSLPPRPTILAWLEMDEQRDRDYFAVSDSVAEYLP